MRAFDAARTLAQSLRSNRFLASALVARKRR
jgi:hypothetical protein